MSISGKSSLFSCINLDKDILNLTDQEIDKWKFQYRKNKEEHDVTEESLASVIPLNPDAYISRFGDDDEVEDDELGAMQESARVPMNKKAPVNDFTESLRVAAGLK
jgi:hypothetical protein